jgi:flagellar hook-basal body complex protein FliE
MGINDIIAGSRFPLTAKGSSVPVNTIHPNHYADVKEPEPSDDVSTSFSVAMQKALEQVNDQQVEADNLTQKMVFNPESVDAHEVMIAAEKARVSLTFTKTVADAVVKAYRELTSLR